MADNIGSCEVRLVRSVTFCRDYPVPPNRLYEAWARVEQLAAWWGCGPETLWKVHAWELEPGGAIHVSQTFDGTPFEVRGEFLVVQAPRQLRFRFGREIVDAQISPTEGGSRLYLQHLELEEGEERPSLIAAGWSHGLDLLARKL